MRVSENPRVRGPPRIVLKLNQQQIADETHLRVWLFALAGLVNSKERICSPMKFGIDAKHYPRQCDRLLAPAEEAGEVEIGERTQRIEGGMYDERSGELPPFLSFYISDNGILKSSNHYARSARESAELHISDFMKHMRSSA